MVLNVMCYFFETRCILQTRYIICCFAITQKTFVLTSHDKLFSKLSSVCVSEHKKRLYS